LFEKKFLSSTFPGSSFQIAALVTRQNKFEQIIDN